MGNESGKKKKGAPIVKVPTPAEIKTYIMVAQCKLTLFRNKKIAENVDTEIIDELIKKLLDAPIDKKRNKGNYIFER